MVLELQCSYSTISSNDLLAKVIPDYNISEPIECLFWERGSTDTYVVRCANARYSLRIYRNENKSRDAVDFEVDALNYLHDNGFPVAYPITRKSGGYITEVLAPEGVRYVLLSAFAEGDAADYDAIEDFRVTGESVAQLHNISDGFKTAHKREDIDLKCFTETALNVIKPYVSHRPIDLAFLEECLETAANIIAKVGIDAMDFGFCHGDIHGGNAHLHNGVLTHFDFEECAFGFRVFDLATFKWGSVDGAEGPEKWAAFVDGYESVRKIRETDAQVLDTFILLRHIWLISFHMSNASDFGGELISDNYIDHHWKKLKRLCSEGIGAELIMNNGFVTFVRLVSDGSAAHSGKLKPGDRIVSVCDTEAKGLSLEDVTDLIVGPKGSTVRLGILSANAPADSAVQVISLIRKKYSA